MSQHLVDNFFKVFTNKIRVKNINSSAQLLKIFKFYDIQTTSFLNFQQFIQAIQKCGYVFVDQNEQNLIFQLFAQNNQVDYKQFIKQIPNIDEEQSLQSSVLYEQKNHQQSSEGVNNSLKNKKLTFVNLFETLKVKLNSLGHSGLTSLAIAIKQVDIERTGSINSLQFQESLKMIGINEELEYCNKIFQLIDASGTVECNQILQRLVTNIRCIDSILRNIFAEECLNYFGIPIRNLQQKLRELNDISIGLEQYLEFREIEQYLAFEDFAEFISMIFFNINNDSDLKQSIINIFKLDQPVQLNKSLTQSKIQIQTQQDQINSSSIHLINNIQSPTNVQIPNHSVKACFQHQQQSINTKQIELIIIRIKNKLSSRGPKAFLVLWKQFIQYDSNQDGQVDQQQFKKAIKDLKIDITDIEIDIVFQFFQDKVSKSIDLQAFISVLRADIKEDRLQYVLRAFSEIDTNQDKIITLNQIRQFYNAKSHPEVKGNRKSQEQVLNEFVEGLISLQELNQQNVNGDFTITLDQFIEYFQFISATINDDIYFQTMVSQVFRFSNEAFLFQNYAGGSRKVFDPNHKKGYVQDHHRHFIQGGSVMQNAPYGTFNEPTIYRPSSIQQQQSSQVQQLPSQIIQFNPQIVLHDTLTALKLKLLQRGLRGLISFHKSFIQLDKKAIGLVSKEQFESILNNLRLDFDKTSIEILAKGFSVEDNLGVQYNNLITQIQGNLSMRKFNIVQLCYDKLWNKSKGSLTLKRLFELFNPADHPDVKSSKQTYDQIIQEFIDTFETFHSIFQATNGLNEQENEVSLDEFIQYYNNVNALVQDDNVFERFVRSSWEGKR